mmetsp:Transcript_31234/g.67363  ORF Transcript_31234/g.67363 Transcript_31234/m.67363 type:complete len:262 (-) Transcript_31234:43-828(-)
MGKTFESLSEQHIAWLLEQKLFFVASAANGGHVNVSPKGYVEGTFTVLSPRSVAYLDFTGSGSETIAHSMQNGRITVMFVAFKGDPVILRLYGTSKCLPRHLLEEKDDGLLQKFGAEFVKHNAFRAVIVVEVHRVQSSCGFSIPFYDYLGERNVLKDYFAERTAQQANEYRILKNSFSIDQLPSIGHRILNNKAPVVAARFKAGFWFGHADVTFLEWLWSVIACRSALSPVSRRDLMMFGLGGVVALGSMLWMDATRPKRQ